MNHHPGALPVLLEEDVAGAAGAFSAAGAFDVDVVLVGHLSHGHAHGIAPGLGKPWENHGKTIGK